MMFSQRAREIKLGCLLLLPLPFGDYVLLRYIETPQVKSFTLPSLGSHEVRVRERGNKRDYCFVTYAAT